MPLRNAQVPPPALFPYYPNNQAVLFNAELLAVAGQYSLQVHVPAVAGHSPKGLTFEGDFSAAPGTFEIDLMEADTDVQSQYTQVPTGGSITIVLAGTTTHVRVDLQPFQGEFFCLFVKTPTQNAVTFTGRVTRS